MTEKSGSQLLALMANNIRQWDQAIASGELIIAANAVLLAEYQQLELAPADLNQTLKSLFAEIIQGTARIQLALGTEKQAVGTELTQMSKKDKMVNSYLVQRDSSIFVDKDF